jgi:hypothetical protein
MHPQPTFEAAQTGDRIGWKPDVRAGFLPSEKSVPADRHPHQDNNFRNRELHAPRQIYGKITGKPRGGTPMRWMVSSLSAVVGLAIVAVAPDQSPVLI